MSRGGRGGARGGRKNVPDFSWDDDETPSVPLANRPAPTFPKLDLPVPRPLDKQETASAKRYLSFRDRTRNGPYFANLDPSNLTDEKGKVDKRAGFDPFNDQPFYSRKFVKETRTVPDLGGREYALQFFPKELWPLFDPKRKHPLWKTLDDHDKLKSRKRKRRARPVAEEEEQEPGSGEDSDGPATGRRTKDAAKSKKTDASTKQATQKRGLDAEDDYPDDQNEDEEGDGDDEPQDSEFEEDDDETNDYNAENYFNDGEDEGFGDDDGGGDGDEGGYF